MKMRFLMVIFLLFCYACVTSGRGNVTFKSKNFYNTLTWDPAVPRVPGQTVRYSVSYGVIDDGKFREKAECQNITELFCDLTAETEAHHDDYYRAKVMADDLLHGVTRKFKPIAETVLGAPTLSYSTNSTSLHMTVTLPAGPKNTSLIEIFSRNHKGPAEAIAVYWLFFTQPQGAPNMIESHTGHFDVSLTNDETEYCGYVVYTPLHEIGRPLSESATFCVKPQDKELMVLPWLLLSLAVVAIVVVTTASFAKCYIKNVKDDKLPSSLVSPMASRPAIMSTQKEQNIFHPEISPISDETVYVQVKPSVSSDAGGYGHKNAIWPWSEDSSLGFHSPGHDQDNSAQSSEIYGAVAVETFKQSQLNQTDRNNTPSLSNLVEKSGLLLSKIKTMSLSSVENCDNSESQPLFLQTEKNSEGQLILSLQMPQTFTGTTEEPVPEKKPLLSYLIVSSDKGSNFVSLHSLESSECSDSGLDENTLPTPTPDCDHSQYLPTQLDLTHFSPGCQSPLSCDNDTPDSGYKQNWMPSSIHENYNTSYPFTWSGLKEECN